MQFKAIGAFKQGTHPPTTRDITAEATWRSSDIAVATINSTGLATAVGTGTTSVGATMSGSLGVVIGTSALTVTKPPSPILSSISIIPQAQTVETVGETAQYIAIGNFGGGSTATKDLTAQVTWYSSDVRVATIGSSGLATAVSIGTTTITAVATGVGGEVAIGTATLTDNIPVGPVNLPTLTVYKVGPHAANGTVTGMVAGTGAPIPINCGAGTGCVGYFPLGALVTLTAVPSTSFAGWSANCASLPTDRSTCTVTMTNNDTVGAIFN